MAMVKINPDALKAELNKKGLNHNDVSEGLGHNRNYLTDGFRRKIISASAVSLLERLYQIERDLYVDKPVSEDVKLETKSETHLENDSPESLIDYDEIEKIIRRNTLTERELYKCIYQAVYKAVKKAWSE